jgi:hypothetical protein
MYPNSDLSAVQLTVMAVVVVAALAAWLTLVLLAARDKRGGAAAADAGRRDEETGATVTRLPSGDTSGEGGLIRYHPLGPGTAVAGAKAGAGETRRNDHLEV